MKLIHTHSKLDGGRTLCGQPIIRCCSESIQFHKETNRNVTAAWNNKSQGKSLLTLNPESQSFAAQIYNGQATFCSDCRIREARMARKVSKAV